jgi:hypothetical protein
LYIFLTQRGQRQITASANDNACAIENVGDNLPKSDSFTLLLQDWKQQYANANTGSGGYKRKEHADYHLSAILIDMK